MKLCNYICIIFSIFFFNWMTTPGIMTQCAVYIHTISELHVWYIRRDSERVHYDAAVSRKCLQEVTGLTWKWNGLF